MQKDKDQNPQRPGDPNKRAYQNPQGQNRNPQGQDKDLPKQPKNPNKE